MTLRIIYRSDASGQKLARSHAVVGHWRQFGPPELAAGLALSCCSACVALESTNDIPLLLSLQNLRPEVTTAHDHVNTLTMANQVSYI
jgi:hypothetical protein